MWRRLSRHLQIRMQRLRCLPPLARVLPLPTIVGVGRWVAVFLLSCTARGSMEPELPLFASCRRRDRSCSSAVGEPACCLMHVSLPAGERPRNALATECCSTPVVDTFSKVVPAGCCSSFGTKCHRRLSPRSASGASARCRCCHNRRLVASTSFQVHPHQRVLQLPTSVCTWVLAP